MVGLRPSEAGEECGREPLEEEEMEEDVEAMEEDEEGGQRLISRWTWRRRRTCLERARKGVTEDAGRE